MRALMIAILAGGCGAGPVSIVGATATVNAKSSCPLDTCWTYNFKLQLVNHSATAVTGLANARFTVGGQTLTVAEPKLPCHSVPWEVQPGATSGTIDLELQSFPSPGTAYFNSFGYPCGEPTTVLTFAWLDGTLLSTAPLQIGLQLDLALDAGGTTTAATQLTATTRLF